MAARSEASVCGRSPAKIVASNPTGGMDICLLRVLCVIRSLCDEPITRPEESYRLWCIIVCDLEAHWGAVAPKEGKKERKKLCIEQFHDLQSSNVMTLIGFGARGTEGGSLPLRVPLKVRHNLEDLGLDGKMLLTHNSGRVTQICVFNTVKLGTSASSP